MIKGVQEFFRWVLLGVWNLLVNFFWLLIQLIELLLWAVSGLRLWIQRSLGQLNQAIAQKDFRLFLSPLKWLLRGIWAFTVQGFWLLIQLIELLGWWVSHLPTLNGTRPQFRNPLPKSRLSNPRLQTIPPENPPRKPRGRVSQDVYRAVALIAVWMAIVPWVALVPFPHGFEGSLLVEEFSFKYGETPQSQVLLEEIKGLGQIAIAGEQRFTLTGQFENPSNPGLNSLQRLTLELPTAESEWEMTPLETDRPSELTLQRLWLRQHTLVEQFSYDFSRLQLVLQPAIRPNVLELSFGNQPLLVRVRGYQITELESETARPNPEDVLEFIWTPEEKQLTLTLEDRAELTAIVPEPQPFDQWIPGDINVENVRFYRTSPAQPTANRGISQSTVIAGRIRMARRSLRVSQHDFLMEDPAQDLEIHKLDAIAIIPYSPEENIPAGIQVGFSGTASQIQVGSEPGIPEERIQGSLLNQWLSQEALLALVPIWAVSLGLLIYWVINNFSKIW
jgi:hypothetical protein